MSTSPKDPNGKPKKHSFWEKLSEKQASGSSGSLVSAIVRQAEKEAGTKKHESQLDKIKSESEAKEGVRTMLANAKTLLGFTIIMVAGIWLYFFAMLHESNYFHEKFKEENLTTELNRKTEILQQLRTDSRDTEKFSKLLQIENLANQVVTIDLEDPILNYERPEGEQVVPRDNPTEILLKTIDENNKVVLLKETEIRSLEDARDIRVEKTLSALVEISERADMLGEMIKSNPEIEQHLDSLLEEITKIDLEEENFPSSTLKNRITAAQSVAKDILRKVKKINLENLIADIKKQAQAIDTNEASEKTQSTVESLLLSLNKLSAQQPSSFDTVLRELKEIDITKISENDIYQKVVRIIGDPRDEKSESDLITAAIIAPNLDRINTIDDLRAERVSWSGIIDQTEKIVRLGSDLTRDTEGTPLDARRDIDPDGKLVTLLSYSGRSRRGNVEIRGEALGEDAYSQKSFTLIADMIDAFEGSKYFKDVEGFAFSKTEDRQGRTSSPLSFQLTIQNPAVTDPRDTRKTEKTKPKTVIQEGDKNGKNIDMETLKDLDFSFSDGTDDEDTESENFDTESEFASAAESPNLVADNDTEFVDVFEALRRILNN
jgi:hypothetical protein